MTTDKIKPGTRWMEGSELMYEWDGSTLWLMCNNGDRIDESVRALESVIADSELSRVDPYPTARDLALAALVEAAEKMSEAWIDKAPLAWQPENNPDLLAALRTALAAWRAAQ